MNDAHDPADTPTSVDTDAPTSAPGNSLGTPDSAEDVPWERLSSRMIWVDAVQSLLALAPIALAVGVFGVEPDMGVIWPAVGIAVFGVAGAVGDALRWVLTRYRVTGTHVERRTGLLVRRHRSVRRERIRTVDATANLRHRLAGLRVLSIGAGQQMATNEAAFDLNALSKEAAEVLRAQLMGGRATTGSRDRPGGPRDTDAEVEADVEADIDITHITGDVEEVSPLARFAPGWVIHNVFTFWAFLMAAGLLWGGIWIGQTFGVDAGGFVAYLVEGAGFGTTALVAVGVAAAGVLGVIGLAVNYFTENWGFELARVIGREGSALRTRKGLFKRREVNRDEARIRGVEIAEPLLWRWMGTSDTNLISTGLAVWSMDPQSTILPRGPVRVARSVAAAVLGTDPSPLEVDLGHHPRAALRRRLWWATAASAALAAVAGMGAATGTMPGWWWLVPVGLLPLALGAAGVAYRALGHALVGPYVVTRSGLMSRSTAALERQAVSTIAVRQSLLQRRLGLMTVSAMTASGYGIYEVPDLDADEAVGFAAQTAPGLLDDFTVRG